MPIEIPVVTRKRAALLVRIARRKIVQSVPVVPRFSWSVLSSKILLQRKLASFEGRQSIRVRETNPIFFETAASSSYFLEVKKNSNNIEQRGVRGMVSRIDFSREIFTCYSL